MNTLPGDLQKLAPYIDTVTPYLDKFGYWALFFGVLTEDFGLPIPGETMLITGALFSSIGSFNIGWVLVISFCGAVIGDNIGYAIGYFGGRKFVVKYGRYVFLTDRRIQKIETFFEQHGGKIIIVARFIEGFRQFNGIVAGTSRMRWSRFLSFNIIGATLWVTFWGSIAYFLGSKLEVIFRTFKQIELYLIYVFISLALFFLIFHFIRRKKVKEDKP